MSFGYFIEHIEYASEVFVLDVYCDEGVGDGGRREVEVALGEKGVELTACKWSI